MIMIVLSSNKLYLTDINNWVQHKLSPKKNIIEHQLNANIVCRSASIMTAFINT